MATPVPPSRPELTATLQKILRLAHEAIPFDKGAIHLLQDGALCTHAVWALPGLKIDGTILGRRFTVEEGFCGYVARTGAPFLSPLVADERRVTPARYQGSNRLIQSFLGIPLRWNEAVIGVLEMDSHTPHFFKTEHVELGEVVADQAAVAIHSARVAEERRQLMRRQELLLHSVEAINSSLDLSQLLERIADHAGAIVGGEAAVGLLDGDRVRFDPALETLPARAPAPPDRWPTDELHDALRAGQACSLAELPADLQGRFPDPGPSLAIPIADPEQGVLGVLLAVRPRDDADFAAEEIQLLHPFAHQAAIGISKGLMLRREQTERRVSEVLREMSHSLSTTLNLDGVVTIVLDQLHDLVHYNNAYIALADGAWLTFVGSRGPAAPPVGERLPCDTVPLYAGVLEKRRPIEVPGGSVEAQAGAELAWLGVPLVANNEVLGVLACDCGPDDDRKRQALDVAVMFADQAAFAIKNAQLYSDTRRLRDYYQQVVDSVEQVIFTTDREGNFTGVNRRWAELVRALWGPSDRLEEGIGLDLSDIPSGGLGEKLRGLLRAVLAGQAAELLEWEHADSDGTRYFQIHATPLSRARGRVGGVTFVLTDVTRQQRLELQLQQQNTALAQSKDQLEALLDATENGIIMSDGEGRVVHVNRAICQFLGMAREEMLGRPVQAVMEQMAGWFDQPAAFQERSAWLYGHPQVVARDNLATAEQPPRLFQRYSAPVVGSARNLSEEQPGRIEVYTDVTQSRRLEERMRQYLDEMLTVHRVSVAMGSEQDLPQLLVLVCEQAYDLVKGSGAAIALVHDDDPEYLVIPVARGVERGIDPDGSLPLEDSVVANVIKQRRPLIISENRGPPAELARLRERWGVPSAVITPLESHDRVIGALMVFNRAPHLFDDHEVQLLQIFAAQAAVTIENIRLLRLAQTRQAELEALTEYNNLLIENSPIGIAVIGKDERFQRANPAFLSIVAADRETIEGLPLEAILPRWRETGLAGLIQDTLAGAAPRRNKDFYYPFLKQGAVWLDLSFSPLHSRDGVVTGVMMTVSDITNRKQLEKDLRLRNERINRQLEQHRALYEIGTQINAELDVQKMLETVMASIRSIFTADGLTMLLPGEAESAFTFVTALGLSDHYLEQEQRCFMASAGGLAVGQRAPMLITDIDDDSRMGELQAAAQQEGLRTALFLPLVYREEVVGLLSLYHRQPYRYSLEEMELLAIFISQTTTAIKNAHFYNSISQSQSNLSAILQSMTDGVVALDEQERIIFINQPLFDLLGIRPDRGWIGVHSHELWPQLHRIVQQLPEDLRHPDGPAVQRIEVELEPSDRIIDLVHTPIMDEVGNKIGRLILLHDVTQMRANERFKDELISIISHELRTPLTSILGYSKLLADHPDSAPEKRARWAGHILGKSRLLNRLLNEVLDLSRLNANRFELNLRPTDLGRLIETIADEQRISSDHHQIEVALAGDLRALLVDPDRIDQLLTNLLVNAIKYSPDGGTITIDTRCDDGWLMLRVSDQGIGIAPEHHEKIFEPFFRVDNSTTRDTYGSGLGLSLCKGIAIAHGGDIWLDSQAGEGATFHIRFPLRRPDSHAV